MEGAVDQGVSLPSPPPPSCAMSTAWLPDETLSRRQPSLEIPHLKASTTESVSGRGGTYLGRR